MGKECLIGAVRVLSNKVIRSIVYDLVVLPEYQNKGIGKALIKQCMEHFPNSEWLVQTTTETSCYYVKIRFSINNDVFLPFHLYTMEDQKNAWQVV